MADDNYLMERYFRKEKNLSSPSVSETIDQSCPIMSFPFMRLPRELRNKVYRFTFRSIPREVHPDATGTMARHNGCSQHHFRVAILRACQLVNEEASAILYATKTFCFSDMEMTSCCEMGLDFECDCIRAEGPCDTIHDSGITGMYMFFRWIGAKNRLRIRHLSITVTDSRLCYYPGEYKLKASHSTAHTNSGRAYFDPDDMRHYGEEHSAGYLIGDAFELLSKGHKLQTLRLVLDEGDEPDKMPLHFLRKIEKSKLLRQIAKLKGLSKVTCQTRPNEYVSQMRVFAILEEEVKKPKPKPKRRLVSGKLSRKTSMHEKAAAFCKNLTAMADEREMLAVRRHQADAGGDSQRRIETIDQVFEQLPSLLD